MPANVAATGSQAAAGITAGSFTSDQLTFIRRLADDTGLDSGVIAAWVFSEENGTAAQSRQAAGNDNWLNIGYFDSGAGPIAFDQSFTSPTTGADQTAKFLKGIWGGASTGIRAILNTVGQSPTAQIGAIRSSGWASSGYPNLAATYAELDQGFRAQLGAGLTPGGAFGFNGTGTPANQASASLWTVGDASNPDQDYWTTINQHSNAAAWYSFSDGETLFVADGYQLMGQTPQGIISRLDSTVIRAEATYDNTAFLYASTHGRKGHVPRRTSLARVISPTEVTIRVICDIDQYRAGDTVLLAPDWGPARGVWLIGDCTRDVFLPYSDLTLVQAMQPYNAATGLTGGPTFLAGPQASAPGSGTVIAAMISEAATLNNDNYQYVWGGGRPTPGVPTIGQPGGNGYDGHTKGFDCSGAVVAVLYAGGLWGSTYQGNDTTIVQTLLSEHKIVPGEGSGSPECTIFDYPGQHIFMRLNGQYWGTASGPLYGLGAALPDNGTGVGWMKGGSPGTAQAYHIPASILGQQASG